MKRFLLAMVALIAVASLAWAANNFVTTDAGGNFKTFKCTESGTVCTLNVIVDAGGGSGGAVTVADGADVTQGAKADTVCATDTGTCTLIALIKKVAANISAATISGCTLGKTLSAATTNSTSVTGAASTLCWINAVNTTTTIYYLKVYDKATAPTCNSDSVKQSMPIPPAGAAGGAGGFAPTFGAFGGNFINGVGFCLTANLADNDNTAAATGVVINYGTR